MVQKKFFGFPKFGHELPPKPGPRSAVSRCFSAAGLGGLIPLVAVVSLVIGCSGSESASVPAAADGRPRVVTTTTIVADLVRQVGGDRVVVECLLGAGIDPHSYKATPRDADRLLRADLVVSSGLHLEGRLADLLARLADRVPVLAVADRLPPDRLLAAEAGIADPHVWFDAGLWSLLPAEVAESLARVDPEGADEYRSRAETYSARLRELDEQVRRRIASISENGRVLVTAHDAFRYFGRAYGIEVVGIQGTNTTAEAGLGDVNRLVELVVDRGIPAVFVETSVADRNVAAVIEGAGARGHKLRLGGRLHSDSLGATPADNTLEGALLMNVETIVAALAPVARETTP